MCCEVEGECLLHVLGGGRRVPAACARRWKESACCMRWPVSTGQPCCTCMEAAEPASQSSLYGMLHGLSASAVQLLHLHVCRPH